jgi:Ca2+-binding EF-hand superfamily protein
VCDADNSGGCSIDEIGNMIIDNFQMLFDLIDFNGDGHMSFDDLVCNREGFDGCDVYALEQSLNNWGMPTELNSFVQAGFEYIDFDSDGVITSADIGKIEQLNRVNMREEEIKRFIMEGLQDMFSVCDTNSDGGCSYREFMDTLKRIAIEPLFNFMDQDNSGQIDAGDMKFLDIIMDKGTADAMIAMCNIDRKGQCSLNEVMELANQNARPYYSFLDSNRDGDLNLEDAPP